MLENSKEVLNKNNSLSEIKNLFEKNDKFLVLSHYSPDPDAYSSSIALALILIEQGKDVVVANASGIIDDLKFLPFIEMVQSDLPADLNSYQIITTDSSGNARLGEEYQDLLKDYKIALNIDHHVSNEFFGDLNWVEKASSCAEVIFHLAKGLDYSVSKQVQDLLAYGIYSDTGSLRYSLTTSSTFRTLAEFSDNGVDLANVSNNLFSNTPLRLLNLKSWVIKNIDVLCDGRFARVFIPEEVFKEFDVSLNEAHYFKEMLRNIEGVLISAVIRSDGDLKMASLRSVPPYDVNKIAQTLGGGGHQQASGIKWKGDLEKLQEGILEQVKIALD